MVTQVKAVIFDQGGVLSPGGEKGTNEKAAAQVMGLRNPIDVPDLKPGEILLLDDQQKCIDGARERGWQAMLVTDLDQMVRDVTRLLDLG